MQNVLLCVDIRKTVASWLTLVGNEVEILLGSFVGYFLLYAQLAERESISLLLYREKNGTR